MSPEAPNPEVPAPTPIEQPAPDAVVEAPVLPEVPEVAADTTPLPVAEEAQIADRMVGPPPEGTPVPNLTPGISFSDGPVAHETGRPVMATDGPGVVGLPGGVVTSTPPHPEFSSAAPSEALVSAETPIETPTETVEPQQ